MALTVTHTYVSTRTTSSDPTVVSADQWNNSSAHTVGGTLESSNISGTLTSSQILSLGSSQLTGTILSSQITSVGSSQVTGTFTSSQILSLGSSQLTGTILSSQITSIGSSQITGTLTSSQIVSIGSSQITGTISSSQISTLGSSQLTGTVLSSQGGTGLTTYTVGDLIVASSANLLTPLSDTATGNALISGGVATAPSYGKIGLGTHVSGTLGSTQLGNPFTVGFTLTPYTTGTISAGTWTPNPVNGNYQYYTNGGAHTISPSTVDSAIDILMYNSSSAGVVTFSTGFTVSSNTGDALTTTSSNQFLVSLRRINAVSLYSIMALQ